MMTYCTLFPSIIHLCEVDNYSDIEDELIDFVYKEHQSDPKGVVRSNGGGWQSEPKYHTFSNILNDTICKTLSTFFGDGQIWVNKLKYCIDTEWININKKGDFNFNHLHPGADLSGVFWIKVPSGTFQIDSPHAYTYSNHCRFYQNSFRDSTNNHVSFPIEPRDGTMLIFPSALYHAVEPNKSSEDRISASFNLTLQDYDKKTI
tara:strand:- start:491 stop:1102 length:612 start_codon:yes stop_codon:yes gene_type:complete